MSLVSDSGGSLSGSLDSFQLNVTVSSKSGETRDVHTALRFSREG